MHDDNLDLGPEQCQRIWHRFDNVHGRGLVFLVRAAITFGHSQLIFEALPGREEDLLFSVVSREITSIIYAFNEALVKKRLQGQTRYRELAADTETAGDYIKTLVLRVSNRERPHEQYRVHLVPFFASHWLACDQLFKQNHPDAPSETGGLLAWLGKREVEVDCLQHRLDAALDVYVNTRLNMVGLASELGKCLANNPK